MASNQSVTFRFRNFSVSKLFHFFWWYRYRFRKFLVSKKVSVSVSKKFGIGKSIGIGFEKFWYRKSLGFGFVHILVFVTHCLRRNKSLTIQAKHLHHNFTTSSMNVILMMNRDGWKMFQNCNKLGSPLPLSGQSNPKTYPFILGSGDMEWPMLCRSKDTSSHVLQKCIIMSG